MTEHIQTLLCRGRPPYGTKGCRAESVGGLACLFEPSLDSIRFTRRDELSLQGPLLEKTFQAIVPRTPFQPVG